MAPTSSPLIKTPEHMTMQMSFIFQDKLERVVLMSTENLDFQQVNVKVAL